MKKIALFLITTFIFAEPIQDIQEYSLTNSNILKYEQAAQQGVKAADIKGPKEQYSLSLMLVSSPEQLKGELPTIFVKYKTDNQEEIFSLDELGAIGYGNLESAAVSKSLLTSSGKTISFELSGPDLMLLNRLQNLELKHLSFILENNGIDEDINAKNLLTFIETYHQERVAYQNALQDYRHDREVNGHCVDENELKKRNWIESKYKRDYIRLYESLAVVYNCPEKSDTQRSKLGAKTQASPSDPTTQGSGTGRVVAIIDGQIYQVGSNIFYGNDNVDGQGFAFTFSSPAGEELECTSSIGDQNNPNLFDIYLDDSEVNNILGPVTYYIPSLAIVFDTVSLDTVCTPINPDIIFRDSFETVDLGRSAGKSIWSDINGDYDHAARSI